MLKLALTPPPDVLNVLLFIQALILTIKFYPKKMHKSKEIIICHIILLLVTTLLLQLNAILIIRITTTLLREGF